MRTRTARVGIIDIGSSTSTLAVYQGGPAGFVDRVEQVGRNLRLMRAIVDGRLTRDGISRTVETLREFSRTARQLGADRIEVLATSAVRDAANRAELVRVVRDTTGLDLTVITGEEEARFAVASVVNTLPVADGLVMDLGGGSLQLARVRRRRGAEIASLPLGSLRAHDAFLRTDPPSGSEMVQLRRHADALLGTLPWLPAAGPVVVGIGGTIRAIAKIHRRSARSPIDHPHGLWLSEADVLDAIDVLSRLPQADRGRVPGLAAHRADTIVAGAVVLAAVLRATHADRLLVSTYGMREGCALRALHGAGAVRDPRQAGLSGRFPCPGGAASRANKRASRLFDRRAASMDCDPTHRNALATAAWIATAGGAERILREPLQGHTQDELIVVARLLGLTGGEVPPPLRELLATAVG